jgi:hypothetical protein
MGKQRRSFTPEFKQEAVDLCRRSGKSECQVAVETARARSLPFLPMGLSLSREATACCADENLEKSLRAGWSQREIIP